jgi:hypothetical protein
MRHLGVVTIEAVSACPLDSRGGIDLVTGHPMPTFVETPTGAIGCNGVFVTCNIGGENVGDQGGNAVVATHTPLLLVHRQIAIIIIDTVGPVALSTYDRIIDAVVITLWAVATITYAGSGELLAVREDDWLELERIDVAIGARQMRSFIRCQVSFVSLGKRRFELSTMEVALSALLTIEVLGIVVAVIVVMPILSVTNLAHAIIDRISIGIGVLPCIRCEDYRLGTAVGSQNLLGDEMEVWPTECEEIMTDRTTTDMVVFSKRTTRLGEKESEHQHNSNATLFLDS